MEKKTTLLDAILRLRDSLRMLMVIVLIEALLIVTPKSNKYGSVLHKAISVWFQMCKPEVEKEMEQFKK